MIAKDKLKELAAYVAGGMLGLFILVGGVWYVAADTVMPGVRVGGVNLSMMSREEAEMRLKRQVGEYVPRVSYAGVAVAVDPAILRYDIEGTIERAIGEGRTVNPIRVAQLVFDKTNLELGVKLDEEHYASWAAQVETFASIPGKEAELVYAPLAPKINNGEDGVEVEVEELRNKILAVSRNLSTAGVEVPVRHNELMLSAEEQEKVLSGVKFLTGKELAVKVEEETARVRGAELASLLSLSPGTAGETDGEKLEVYAQGLATRYNRAPQDAKFVFETGRVQEFAPARDGIEVLSTETGQRIAGGVRELLDSEQKTVEVEAVVARTPPTITTESVNNLGIVELIGRGESYYAHSIANRIYNVGLSAGRVSGALVAPGGEFSFNNTVGEISAATGYRTAYVIQNGRTELGDGGGVCQVSTTLFRAAMEAGLPITERWPHAYRVSYYELNSKPGVDATIFSPSKDLKFVNDTPGHILIQAINDPKNLHLVFEIYGTSDGRVATISEPRVSGVTPPPPDLYQDDPTLPAGQVKQVDWSAWGARASFDYKVERGGETIFAKTFNSNYRPWANVYLRGTGEVVAQ